MGEAQLSSLDALDAALPRAQQIELRNLKSGALNGQWAMETVRDEGLWKLMAALWQPSETVDPTRSAFHALVGLRRAYDLTRSGELEAAGNQADTFLRSRAVKSLPAEVMSEAYTVATYVAVATSACAGGEKLALAEEHARKAAETGGAVAERNLALVRTGRETPRNQREPMTNPFLELDLDHGAEGWDRHCRDFFRQYAEAGDQTGQSRVNRAQGRIEEALRHDSGLDVFFRLPLAKARYQLPDAVPGNWYHRWSRWPAVPRSPAVRNWRSCGPAQPSNCSTTSGAPHPTSTGTATAADGPPLPRPRPRTTVSEARPVHGPEKKTAASRGVQKINKNQRPHRPCPHCGRYSRARTGWTRRTSPEG
ncbi:hypothetical protein ACR6C2_40870 [Streptomyces sp. INA 01156]